MKAINKKSSTKILIEIARRVKPIKKYLRVYINRYGELFDEIRNKPLTILEIGIGGYNNPNKGGGSLRMWAEFFPNATIIGLDHFVKELELPKNVKIECGSQTDVKFLNYLSLKYGGFDIVIDDASHVTDKTIISFETLFDNTRLFYIVEDLHMKTAKGTKQYFENIDIADLSTLNLCILYKNKQNDSTNNRPN
jgi:hypothetical protein